MDLQFSWPHIRRHDKHLIPVSTEASVTASNMNNCVVAFVLAGLILQGRPDGRHHYAARKLDSYSSLLAYDSSEVLAEDKGNDGDDIRGG